MTLLFSTTNCRTRVIQKIIETIKTPEQYSLIVSTLRPYIVSLIKNNNGSHVAQRCLQHLPDEHKEARNFYLVNFLFCLLFCFCTVLFLNCKGIDIIFYIRNVKRVIVTCLEKVYNTMMLSFYIPHFMLHRSFDIYTT